MGQGQDRIAKSLLDLQPTAILDFYRLYPDIVNKPNLVINIHGGSIFKGPITWQGIEYQPVSIEAEGFELTSNTRLPRPKIRIANKDYLITSLLMNNFDFKNAQVVRKRTFLKHIDDVNFDGGNPFGEADSTAEISEEKYVIGQKTQENKIFVEFELTSPLDLENFEVNHRKILGKYCYWMYRGQGCNYDGPPINRENGQLFLDPTGGYVVPNIDDFSNSDPSFLWQATKTYQKSDIVYRENKNIIINPVDGVGEAQPMKLWYVCVSGNVGQRPEENPTYWQKDGCNKKLSSCRLRFADSFLLDYVTNEVEYTGEYIRFSGASVDGNYTGRLFTDNPNVTGVFANDNFTVGMWIKPIGANSAHTNASYFSINTGDQKSMKLISNTATMQTNAFTLANKNVSKTIGIPVNSNSYSFILMSGSNIAATDQLNVYQITSNTSNLLAEIRAGGVTLASKKLNFTSNQFSIGANLQTVLKETPSFDLGAIMLWSGSLNNQEISELVKQAIGGQEQCCKYNNATSSLKSKLVSWWESTGTVNGQLGFIDSHNSYDLTGEGFYSSDYYTYSKYGAAQTKQRLQTAEVLPFGGFPGTDGFNYQA